MRNTLLGMAAFAVLLVGCDQPKVRCVTTAGGYGYAMRYAVKSSSGTCAEQPGDVAGLKSYNPSQSNPQDGPDIDKLNLAMQPSYLGYYAQVANDFGVVDPDPNHKWYAFGGFAAVEPDGSDFCSVPSMVAAEQNIPEVAYDDDGDGLFDGPDDYYQPPISLKYAFSNVQIYTTAAAPGTQFTADLSLTEDGCTVDYSVLAMWPNIYCQKLDVFVDPDTGESYVDYVYDDQGNPVPDDSLCDDVPDPQVGIPFGSGINTAFKATCDPSTLYCMQGSRAITPTD